MVDKNVKNKTSLPPPSGKQVTANDAKRYHLGQLQESTQLPNENKLQLVTTTNEPLSLHQDQLQKQLVNTIREVPEQFFEDLKHVISANDKLSIFRKHIPKQKEIDALLANLRK